MPVGHELRGPLAGPGSNRCVTGPRRHRIGRHACASGPQAAGAVVRRVGVQVLAVVPGRLPL
eukprot:8921843-Pyramimonas_sp.AAC.1